MTGFGIIELMSEIRIECKGADVLPLDAIEEFQGNLKKRTKSDIQKIITSIEKYGFSFPFFVWNGDGHNRCLDGHGRIQALSEMRKNGVDLPLFPVSYVEAKTEGEARQKLLRLNSQYGKMSMDSVLEFADGLEIEKSELNLPGVNFDPAEKNMIGETEKNSYYNEFSDDISMYNNTPIFRENLDSLEIPKLRTIDYADLDFSKTIGVYKNKSYDINLLIPGSIKANPDLHTIMCFYTGDERFENMFSDPGFCLDTYKKNNISEIIAPNFSMYKEWPLIVRLYGLYKSRFSSRYMVKGGIKIIPDLQLHYDDYKYFVDCIEPHIPCAAIQMHTSKNKALVEEKIECLKKAIEDLKVEKIICYTDKSFDITEYIDSIPAKNVLSFATERFSGKK
jgi:hypothetical protein